jgi:hypothetical protein
MGSREHPQEVFPRRGPLARITPDRALKLAIRVSISIPIESLLACMVLTQDSQVVDVRTSHTAPYQRGQEDPDRCHTRPFRMWSHDVGLGFLARFTGGLQSTR